MSTISVILILIIYTGLLIILYFVLIRPNSKRIKQERQNKQENHNIEAIERSSHNESSQVLSDYSQPISDDNDPAPSEKKFCPYCGQPLSRLSETYCENCGERL